MSENTTDNETIDKYKHLRDIHLSMLFRSSESYYKAVLTLSSITLGFTFALLEYLKGPIVNTCLLVASLVFLILTIILILLDFIVVQNYSSSEYEHYRDYVPGQNNSDKQNKIYSWLMPTLMYASCISISLGLITLTIFVATNLI